MSASLALRGGAQRLTETERSRAVTTGTAPSDRDAERAQLKQLAQEFEAMLMNELLSGWRRSLISSGDDDEQTGGFAGLGGFGTMTDMVGTEFGRALGRAGGLGIADVLLRSFDRQVTPDTASTPYSRAAEGALEPAPLPITSGFGWRPDPFTGRSTFHAGVDVRMAYGQPVTNLADGRVSFAGDLGGYGLTVVVDHPDGRQTRYAHLSSIDVQIGDAVGRGQSIARSGSSGRSTGPHLHVELLQDGRPVDPTAHLGRQPESAKGGFKRAGTVADWVS